MRTNIIQLESKMQRRAIAAGLLACHENAEKVITTSLQVVESFIFLLVVKVDLPSTSQTAVLLLLYCERSGVGERRLRMTAVFCCGC